MADNFADVFGRMRGDAPEHTSYPPADCQTACLHLANLLTGRTMENYPPRVCERLIARYAKILRTNGDV